MAVAFAMRVAPLRGLGEPSNAAFARRQCWSA
jgi:hypothetical protein